MGIERDYWFFYTVVENKERNPRWYEGLESEVI